MSDPYGYDRNSDPQYDSNADDSGAAALWAGIAIAAFLIVGTIVGLIGKFLAPGDKDNIPLWLTVICGIAGG